jgi:4-hydroxyproline epimerase
MVNPNQKRLRAIDSHTAGEPTRVVIDGGPPLTGSLPQQLEMLRTNHDDLRAALCTEPRASDIVVGALLTTPVDPSSVTGVIFFNNVGYLGMCGHGTIGVITTLAWLGRISAGIHRIETPVGVVTTELHDDGQVSVRNVPAYRYATNVVVDIPGQGPVTGDIAWGGNWFFLCSDHRQTLAANCIPALTEFAGRLRHALDSTHVTGEDGAPIDHIELMGPSDRADSRNFVLCPGGAYDRSPCGTGTSAKLACLHADGKLQPGDRWRQESIIGSVFEGRIELDHGHVIPTITGRAWVTADTVLVLDETDPYCYGISAPR